MDSGATYLHGTSPSEQGRLSLLNRLMNEAALDELSLRGGEKVVDFGSGLGQLSRGIARAAGRQVVAIERSAEWGSFDVAHARFILEHVPDPGAVVRQMVRAVRPGGRIVLQDDDHDVLRCYPEPAGFSQLWRAYARTYHRLGCDPYVGRRLVSLLHESGAAPRRCDFIFFGGCAGEPKFASLMENMTGLLVGARETIVGQGLLGAAEFDAAVEALGIWTARPDASFWYAIFWAEGVRR